jgi:hypothetical protein
MYIVTFDFFGTLIEVRHLRVDVPPNGGTGRAKGQT